MKGECSGWAGLSRAKARSVSSAASTGATGRYHSRACGIKKEKEGLQMQTGRQTERQADRHAKIAKTCAQKNAQTNAKQPNTQYRPAKFLLHNIYNVVDTF
jgi:hypothetical protein